MSTSKVAKLCDISPLVAKEESDYAPFFYTLTDELLNKCVLRVADAPYRLVEIEVYFHGGKHPDVFAHCDVMQCRPATWYFHRHGSGYKGGTYKGLDLAFGSKDMEGLGECFGGVLIRAIERVDGGEVIEGSCRVVDHILEKTGNESILDLIGKYPVPATEETGPPCDLVASPLYLEYNEALPVRRVYQSARVGLSLKKGLDGMMTYVLRPYRFVTVPSISKGRVHLGLNLHMQGLSVEEITATTGMTASVLAKYIEDFESGRRKKRASFISADTANMKALCQLHGSHFEALMSGAE